VRMRNIFRISSRLQIRYLRLIVFSSLVPTVFVAGCLYYLVFSLIAEEIAIPEYVMAILVPPLARVNLILLVGVPIIVFVLYCWGLVLSQRLAGPIDRFKREIDEVLVGNYKKRIHVRQGDALKPFVDDINKLLDKIGESKH